MDLGIKKCAQTFCVELKAQSLHFQLKTLFSSQACLSLLHISLKFNLKKLKLKAIQYTNIIT